MPVEITRSFGHPEQTLKVPLLIKSATYQSGMVCLFLQSLFALYVGGWGESTSNFTQGASKAETTGEPPTYGGKPGLAIDFYVGRALAV